MYIGFTYKNTSVYYRAWFVHLELFHNFLDSSRNAKVFRWDFI